MNWFSGRVLIGLACVVMGASACSAPEAVHREKKSSTQSTLGKPKPSIKTAASLATTDKYGITEWRLFRGKQDLFMTGYDADGKPVKGVSLAFNESEDDGSAQVVTRIHDGSNFAAARNLASQALTAGDLPAGSADFLQSVLGDLGGIGALFQNALGGLGADGAGTGLQLPAGAEQCGADITAVLNQALTCTQNAGQAKAAQAACVAAAKIAAESATACQNVGGVDATGADNAGDATGGIDLSKLGLNLPIGGDTAGGIDLSKILGTGGADGDTANPFGAGGLNIQNPFGGGLDQLFGNPANGDVGFQDLGGFFGF